MRKIISFVLAAALLLSLTACAGGGTTSTETSDDQSTLSSTAATEATEPSEAPTEPEMEFKAVSLGGTIETDFVKITLDSIGNGTMIKGSSGLPLGLPDGSTDVYVWLKLLVTNQSENAFQLSFYSIPCEFTFDGENTYKAFMYAPDDDAAPATEREAFLAAMVPPETLASFQTMDIRLGFNKSFDTDATTEWKDIENLYVYNGTHDDIHVEEPGIWSIYYYVDEFKQPTDNGYIINEEYIVGTFSNSATSDSLLKVQLLVDKEDFAFFLYEYGNHQVKNASSRYVDQYNITMRDSNGVDHKMTGTVYCGGDRLFVDDAYKADMLAALQGEGNISFYISDADRSVSNYLFTVQVSNFAETYQSLIGS